jgi:hypothetical protein
VKKSFVMHLEKCAKYDKILRAITKPWITEKESNEKNLEDRHPFLFSILLAVVPNYLSTLISLINEGSRLLFFPINFFWLQIDIGR